MDPKKKATYTINAQGTAITCLRCGLESFNPNDVQFLYCGQCHKFHKAVP
jgi:ribosomal protein S27AE